MSLFRVPEVKFLTYVPSMFVTDQATETGLHLVIIRYLHLLILTLKNTQSERRRESGIRCGFIRLTPQNISHLGLIKISW